MVGQDSRQDEVFPDELVTGGRVHFVEEREHVGQDHAGLVVLHLLCNQQINISYGKFTILLCISITCHYIFNDVHCIQSLTKRHLFGTSGEHSYTCIFSFMCLVCLEIYIYPLITIKSRFLMYHFYP